ncbi:tyrosine-type recombinase/integrase, partial [Halorhodospira abdelmalekii]|uniref:tyrosine-type recombinase/integrase n=1 Tax=Halorhodospira abdelmalekii TaxID=421629 RepID=UPI001F5B34FB
PHLVMTQSGSLTEDATMSTLRHRMIAAMHMHGFSAHTHESYWPAVDLEVTLPKRAQRIPELLTRAEVAAILAACGDRRYRTMLSLCYGAGLRLSEVLTLRVADIDGERKLLRIAQGKGAKDRLVVLSPSLLEALRAYWRLYRPREWLFPSRDGTPLSPTSL